jgi:hypothetical protein
MENKDVLGRAGAIPKTRRAFLSASAVTAVAAPLLSSGTALAETDPALSRQAPDPGLRAMLHEIDPRPDQGDDPEAGQLRHPAHGV